MISIAGLLLHLLVAGGPTPNGTACALQPLWCDPKMVPLRIVDARGEMEVRAEDGETIRWARPGWAGGVSLSVQRLGRGKTRLQLFIEVEEKRRLVTEAVLSKGEALEVRPPEGVPPHYFGPHNAPVRFICGE